MGRSWSYYLAGLINFLDAFLGQPRRTLGSSLTYREPFRPSLSWHSVSLHCGLKFLAKNLSNFVSLPWKLHNRYCHTAHSDMILAHFESIRTFLINGCQLIFQLLCVIIIHSYYTVQLIIHQWSNGTRLHMPHFSYHLLLWHWWLMGDMPRLLLRFRVCIYK